MSFLYIFDVSVKEVLSKVIGKNLFYAYVEFFIKYGYVC